MIDLHAHVLPGLDDGPPDLPAALALLRAMADEGITTVVASPHCDPDRYPTTAPQVLAAVELLTREAGAAGLAMRILPGMELTLTPDLVARLRSGTALAIAGTRYVCVELPHLQFPRYAEAGLFALMAAGYRPVLNHPERNRGIQERPERFERLAEQGVLGLVTAGSLLGRFGPAAQELAETFVAAGLAPLVATDAHDTRRRPPELRLALERAQQLGKSGQSAESTLLAVGSTVHK